MRWTDNFKLIVPHPVLGALRSIRNLAIPPENDLTFAPEGWNTLLPSDAEPGYNSRKVIEIERRREWEPLMRQLRSGELEISSTVRDQFSQAQWQRLRLEQHNTYTTFGYVLALAAHKKNELRILDYGGNLGYYYCIGRFLTPHIALDYHCKELPAMAEEGRRLNSEVKWHTDDSCLNEEFDLTIFSCVLPYIEQWQNVLRVAAGSTRHYLYIALQPTVDTAASYVAIQRFGGAAMLYQSLNRHELLDVADASHLRTVREFWFGEHLPIRNAPEQPSYYGWLFEKA